MKTKLFILIGLLCCQIVVQGEERGPSWNLRNWLSLKDYFKAKEEYAANVGSGVSDFARLYYDAAGDVFYNRPATAVLKLERLLAEYSDSLSFRGKLDVTFKLAEQYEKIGDYDKALALINGIGVYTRQHKTITRNDSLYFAEYTAY